MLNHPNRPGRNRVVRRVPRRRIRRPTLVRGLAPACNCSEDAAKTYHPWEVPRGKQAVPRVFCTMAVVLGLPFERHGAIRLSEREMSEIFLDHEFFLYNDDCKPMRTFRG